MAASPAPDGLPLSPAHWQELSEESGLGVGIIKARGYHTTTDTAYLQTLGFPEPQVPAGEYLVIPHRDHKGDITGYQIKPTIPRPKSDGSKPAKYELPAGHLNRLDIPNAPLLRAALGSKDVPLYITEGSKKADAGAQAGLCILSVNGVYGWRGQNDLGGTTTLADWEDIALKGRTTYIVFDNDVMTKREVRNALIRLARWLKKRGAKVHAIVLKINGVDDKLGLDNYLVKGKAKELLSCVDDSVLSLEQESIRVSGRPGTEIHEEALAALIAANDPPTVFVRAGELTKIIDDGFSPPKIEDLGKSGLRNRLTSCVGWHRLKPEKDEVVRVPVPHCPPDVVEHFLAERHWPGIPHIAGITSHPILTPSGKISSEPGYCEESKYYIVGNAPPPWPGTPESAVDFLINDVLVDFCFKDHASIAHALALMILPVVRPAIDGATPLHVIDAPIMNSGKSKLAEALLLVTQPEVEGQGAPKTEEEWTKSLVTSLRYLPSYVFFDDLGGKLESNELNGVLTSKRWSGRLLGTNDKMKVPITAAWIVTSNNIKLSPDLSERSIWIRLDTGMPDPGRRTEFKHPDLKWIRRENAKILSAVLCIVEHGARKNFPFTGRKHNKYSEWSSVIGGILESCGVTGFMSNFDQMRISADPISDAVNDFISRVWNIHRDAPMFASSLVELWEINEELAGLISTAKDKTKAFGRQLAERKDRVFAVPEGEDGTPIYLRLTTPDRTVEGKRIWKLVPEVVSNHPENTNHCPNHCPNQTQKVVSGVSGVSFELRTYERTHERTHPPEQGPNETPETTLTPETTFDPITGNIII